MMIESEVLEMTEIPINRRSAVGGGNSPALRFTLPWPPKELSSNARLHYMALARAKKSYRTACAWQAKAQGAGRIEAERLSVHLVFVPPDRRMRDDQNLIAAMKSGLDGLADVLGVDDSKWHVTHDPYSTDTIGGMVKVEVVAG